MAASDLSQILNKPDSFKQTVDLFTLDLTDKYLNKSSIEKKMYVVTGFFKYYKIAYTSI